MSSIEFNSPSYYERAQEQKHQQTIMLAGGLSAVLAVIVGVWLAVRTRRPPTRIQQAEATLANAASRAEQAARTVRKKAPSLVERGAGQVEQAARTIRKQGPSYVERSGSQLEQWGRSLRKNGPGVLVNGASRVEQAARTVRKQAPGMVAQGATRAEQAARTVRKQGPAKLRASYEQTEQAWNRTRDFGTEVGTQAGQVIDSSRKVGETVVGTAQSFTDKLRNRFKS